MKKLFAKDVRMGIKNGMTVQDFCIKYRCNEDELRSTIEKLYTQKKSSAKIWNEILANDKKPRKAKATESSAAIEVVETAEAIETEKICHVAEPSRVEKLQALEEKISQSSDILMRKEAERQELISEHRETIKEIKKTANRIDKLAANIAAEYDKVQALFQKCDDNRLNQSAMWKEIVSLKEELEEDRRQAEQMKIIEVCLYKDGYFEVSDDVSFDATQIDAELFEKLLHHEDCVNFTVSEIRNLAKLLKFAAESELKVEVTCDNSNLEAAFVRFRAEFSGQRETVASAVHPSSEKLPRPR